MNLFNSFTNIRTPLCLALLMFCTFSSAESRNVILIIGDGMDDQQITIARNYLKGTNGRLVIDSLPIRAAVQVQTVDEDNPSKDVYVADSANSASSIATGKLTSRGRISTAAKTGEDLTTIIEIAEKAGYKTGIVSTASVTDATPASFIAHIDKRFCENPSQMIEGIAYGHFEVDCKDYTKANGRRGSISEQLVDSDVDVILGGGNKHFNFDVEDGSNSLLNRAKDNNFLLVNNDNLLDRHPFNKKLLGLFSPSTMPVKLRGENGRIAEKPKRSWLNYIYQYIGTITVPDSMQCEPNPDFEQVPSLVTMSQAAINHLTNDKGFFLIIESASIDKQAHQRNPCGSIGELEQLDDTLNLALNFAKKSPNTLILVTADHGQAAQIIPQTSMYTDPPFGNLTVGTPGAMSRLHTKDNSIIGINYATNESFSEEHTGVNVPLFANDANQSKIPTLIAQRDIFHIMLKYLQL